MLEVEETAIDVLWVFESIAFVAPEKKGPGFVARIRKKWNRVGGVESVLMLSVAWVITCEEEDSDNALARQMVLPDRISQLRRQSWKEMKLGQRTADIMG